MACAVNPGVGFERKLGDGRIGTADIRRRVCVVGGGPAGMEAARVAALRGHRVTLLEATQRLGGMLNLAARLPKRHGMIDIAVWLEAEIHRLGVDVRLGCYAEAGEVLAENPDAVIVATGSCPRLDGIQSTNPGEPAAGMDRPGVYSSVDLLTIPVHHIGKTALVVDDTGHYEAIGVAEYLVENGASVTFVTTCVAVAPKVESALMVEPVLTRLARHDFRVLTRHRLVAVRAVDAEIAPIYTAPSRVVAAETVVFVSSNEPNRGLYSELEGKVASVKIVGDALSPRFISAAFREGQMAAKAI
jgi:pyruvate/2-oxoglutarate dehydrogenase complex dihydrolipoamide dehydrogenase (E3) component